MTALLGLMPMPYRLLALALLAAAIFGYGWLKGNDHAEAKLAAFIAETRVEGVKAQATADARAAADRERKDKSDASYQKALTLAGADLKRLRDASAGSYIVPRTAPDTGIVEARACFDQRAVDDAIRAFATGVAGLVGEGEAMRLRLDNAIQWAR